MLAAYKVNRYPPPIEVGDILCLVIILRDKSKKVNAFFVEKLQTCPQNVDKFVDMLLIFC